MSDYTEALLEDDFHVNEVCMYILSRMLNIGIGVVTRTDTWSTTQSLCQTVKRFLHTVGRVSLYQL